MRTEARSSWQADEKSFLNDDSESDAGDSAATLSGAQGKRLELEVADWIRKRTTSGSAKEWAAEPQSIWDQSVWELAEVGVKKYYDKPVGSLFNFVYDLLQFSSGRDKLCGLLQNVAKIMSATSRKDSEMYWMHRAIEESLSDGRKIFRFFKEFREVYKIRRGFHRLQSGIAEAGWRSIPAVCGTLDIFAHLASFVFYFFDNLIWAASVGLVRSKEIPKWQQRMWAGGRANGAVINYFGGMTSIKWKKNMASFIRVQLAFLANILLMRKAIAESATKDGGRLQGKDDPRIFHTIELIGMAASFRDLLSRLGASPMESHVNIGLLGIAGSVCGLWNCWRKVRKDKCGTKTFSTVAERRATKTRVSIQ